MKKLFIAAILLTTACFAFAPLLAAQMPTAVIKELTGTVELKISGSADWVPANTGDIIDKSTIISTGFKSVANIAIGNSTLHVRPITRLSLEELMSNNDTETIDINLNTGRIKVEVSPPAGSRANLTIQTPSAVASVRGTSFEMDTVSIQVLTGAVSYASSDSPADRPVTIIAGQGTFFDTETGTVLNPMAAADISRELPPLPGQGAGTLSEDSGSLAVLPQNTGTANFEIDWSQNHD